MTESEIAQKSPYKIELTVGQEYWWCAWMCGCKHTAGRPFCDKTHKRI
jgi:CDGSH-type Zn-finger protein